MIQNHTCHLLGHDDADEDTDDDDYDGDADADDFHDESDDDCKQSFLMSNFGARQNCETHNFLLQNNFCSRNIRRLV